MVQQQQGEEQAPGDEAVAAAEQEPSGPPGAAAAAALPPPPPAAAEGSAQQPAGQHHKQQPAAKQQQHQAHDAVAATALHKQLRMRLGKLLKDLIAWDHKRVRTAFPDGSYPQLFKEQVTEEVAPHYSSVIAHPMSLDQMDAKLKASEYGIQQAGSGAAGQGSAAAAAAAPAAAAALARFGGRGAKLLTLASLDAVAADLRLMADNCRKYNEGTDPILEMANEFEAVALAKVEELRAAVAAAPS